ncbi:MAG: NAD(+)/NADH kinase [Candidatus Niyogibacteria bacterium]|nr:NAD(+)/NADH kinase [Candidatus Niyogibacteria bacterium]
MKRIAIYGGSFNPPGVHHRLIAQAVAEIFDEVVILPCGPRPDKRTVSDIDPLHRAAMADLTFHGLGTKVRVELFDLENSTFTRNHEYDRIFGGADIEIWHVVGPDLVARGAHGDSMIHRVWQHGAALWQNANFVVALGRGVELAAGDLPPHHLTLRPLMDSSSTDIRGRAFNREDISELVTPGVAEYIEKHGLYRGNRRAVSNFKTGTPRPLLFVDERNPEAQKIKEKFLPFEDVERPNMILVVGGDGTMLHAIRKFWRLRLPFLGVNVGHLGFLLNDVRAEIAPEFLEREFILHHSPLLHVETETLFGEHRATLAFNDAWVEADHGKTGWFGVRLDQETVLERLVGSGILAATPAGSTAYARAMGAMPLPIIANLLTVVGSNVSQPIGWRGICAPLSSEVEFFNADASGWRKMFGFVDGVPLGEVRRMLVRASEIAAVELAFLPEHDPMRKLLATQFPKY